MQTILDPSQKHQRAVLDLSREHLQCHLTLSHLVRQTLPHNFLKRLTSAYRLVKRHKVYPTNDPYSRVRFGKEMKKFRTATTVIAVSGS